MSEEQTQEVAAPTVDTAAIEAEAAEYGWAPEDKWRGPKDAFIPANEFLRRAHQHLPIVNSRLKAVTERFEKEQAERKKVEIQYSGRVAELERRLNEEAERREAMSSETDKQLRAQQAAHTRMMDLQRTQLLEQFEGEKRAALTIDDPHDRQTAYDIATRRERDAIKNFVEAEKPGVPEPAQPKAVAEKSKSAAPTPNPDAKSQGDAWMAKNTWLRDNPELMRFAGTIEIPAIPSLDFNVNPEAHLDFIKSKLKSIGFAVPGDEPAPAAPTREAAPVAAPAAQPAPAPQTPATPAAPRHSAVEGAGTRSGGSSPKEKGYKELPAAAKAAVDGMIASKRLKGDPEVARKAYAENYWREYDV